MDLPDVLHHIALPIAVSLPSYSVSNFQKFSCPGLSSVIARDRQILTAAYRTQTKLTGNISNVGGKDMEQGKRRGAGKKLSVDWPSSKIL